MSSPDLVRVRAGQVLGLLFLAGRSPATAAEIAAHLHLSEGTVRNYLSAAIRKLDARNRAEALRIAEEKGSLSR